MLLIIYLAVINLITIIVFGIDKRRAKNDAWRVKEATLLGLSFIGGALGGFIGMQVFRHKTKKPLFVILVPLFIILHILILFFVFR